jgi:putative redox protein
VKVVVSRLQGATFEAKNEKGATLRMEGPSEIGGKGEALRPLETVLAALAGSSAIDVMKILQHQKEPLEDLVIHVDAKRADSVPAVFEEIHVHFELRGPLSVDKAKKAVSLSMEKYCSVVKMLELSVHITHDVVVNGGATS